MWVGPQHLWARFEVIPRASAVKMEWDLIGIIPVGNKQQDRKYQK